MGDSYGGSTRGRQSLYPEEGYGFIETSTGDEILFNRKSVLNDAFGRLKAGSNGRSLPVRGKTPEASAVRI